MKRNALLMTAALFCLATSALAADGKNAQPQPQQTEQSQMARIAAEGSKDHASPAKSDSTAKPNKQSKQKHQRTESQSDLELWQSQLIYGGG